MGRIYESTNSEGRVTVYDQPGHDVMMSVVEFGEGVGAIAVVKLDAVEAVRLAHVIIANSGHKVVDA